MNFIRLLIILLLHPANCNLYTASFYFFTVQISNTIASVSTSYSFKALTNTAVSQGDSLVITFPYQYQGISQSSSLTCIFGDSPNIPCSYSYPNLTIQSVPKLISSSDSLDIQVSPITNPSNSQLLDNFFLYNYNKTGSLIQSGSCGGVTISPKNMPFAKISIASDIVAANTTWVVEFSISQGLNASSTIELATPIWNDGMGSPYSRYYCAGTVQCTGTIGKAYLGISGSLPCVCSQGTVILTLAANINTGKYGFSISSMTNPPSCKTVDGFSLMTKSGQYYIEQYSISVTMTQPASLVIKSVSLASSVVSTYTSYLFSFQVNAPICKFYYISIKFPSEFSISQTSYFSSGIILSAKNTSSVNSNTITLTSGISSYFNENFPSDLTVKLVLNPYSTKVSSPITITITNANSDLVANSTTGFSLTPTSGTFSGISITGNDSTIYSNAIYTLTMNLDQPVKDTSYLLIKFPAEITVQSGSSCSVTKGLLSSSECQVTSSTLKITKCFSGTYLGQISFSLGLVSNPVSTATTSPFIIQAYSDENYLILYNNNTLFKATPGLFAAPSVTTGLLITGAVTWYSFQVTLSHKIPAGGQISIEFPPEIQVGLITCSATGLSAGYTCTASSNYITVSSGFLTDKTSGTIALNVTGIKNPGTTQTTTSISIYSSLNSNPIDKIDSGLGVTMKTANTYQSVLVTQSSLVVGGKTDLTFLITPFNPMYSQGYVNIYFPSSVVAPATPSCAVGVNVTKVSCNLTGGYVTATLSFANATTLSSFSFKVLSCTNPKNSSESNSFQIYGFINSYAIDMITTGVTLAATSPGNLIITTVLSDYGILQSAIYTFTITPTNPVPQNGFVDLIFSPGFNFTSPVECTSVVSCQLTNSSRINITLPAYSQQFGFTVKNLKNPPTIGSKSISVTSYSGTYFIDSGNTSIQITCHPPCATCSSSADTCLTCLPPAPFLYNSTCYATCPPGTVSNQSTCVNCQDPCIECSGSPSTCTKCKSPKVLLSSTCADQCGSGKFNNSGICSDCMSNCQQCPSLSVCQQCFSSFYLSNGTCVNTCPQGTVNMTTVCSPCLSPCSTCHLTVSQCLSCISNYSFYQGKCFKDCPDGTLSVGQTCQTCSAPCVTCSGTVSHCTSCYLNWFLYNSQCFNQCPEGSMTVGNNCIECGSLCSSCNNVSSNCTRCFTNAALYQTSCVSSCPDNSTLINQTCNDCLYPCGACSGSTSFCTSCLYNYLLYNSSCFIECPKGTIGVNKTCVQCEGNCWNCFNSTTNCTSCEFPYYLYNNSCLETCPEGYNGTSSDRKCKIYECSPGCNYTLLNNSICDQTCNTDTCKWDNGKCSYQYIALKSAPLPFTITGLGTSGTMAASKLFFPVTSLTSATTATWGVVESLSWFTVLNSVASSQSTGRRLLSDDSSVRQAFIFLLICFVGHFLINIVFGVIYLYYILEKDYTHKFWMSTQKVARWVVFPLAVLINFKFIRLLDSRLFGFSCFNANYDKKSNLYKPLILFICVSIVLTTLPTLASLIYILVVFNSNSMAFALALDSVLITLLQLLLHIYDIFILTILIADLSSQNKQSKNVTVSPNNELMNTQQFTIFHTKTDEKCELDNTGRIHPEPEDEKDFKESLACKTNEEMIDFENPDSNPIIFEPKPPVPLYSTRADMWNISFENIAASKNRPPPRILEIINEENDLDLSTAKLDEGSTIIANHIPSGRRVLISKTFKDSINIEDPDKLLINYDQYVLENVDPDNLKFGMLRSKATGNSVKVNRNFNQSQVIDVEENGEWTIGKVVRKEEDFDFAHAFQDPDDPEAVVVWNKIGKVYTIVKKDFKGLPKLDIKSNLPKFNERMINNYDTKSLEIDPRNVHFANLIADGEKVRVRRNFIGGRILEVIDKDKYLDKKKRKMEIVEEPELELKEEELDYKEPDIIFNIEPRRRIKKQKKKKNKGWDNIEAIYLQRLEPSIKLTRPRSELSNTFLGKTSEEHRENAGIKVLKDEFVDIPRPKELEENKSN